MRRRSLALWLLLGTPCAAPAREYVVKAFAKVCVHGLHRERAGGPFAVFLFCADALGSNIGVINTVPGAGPGRIVLPHPKTWDKWDVTRRFWQETEWAADVTSFAWSPDLKSLYVGTMEIYGDGALYRLDLVTRTVTRLIPNATAPRSTGKGYHSAEITGINRQTGEVSVDFSFTDESDKTTVPKVVIK